MNTETNKFTLLFYNVNNSKEYDRHHFDAIYNDVEAIVTDLKQLSPSEYELKEWTDRYELLCEAAELFNDWDNDIIKDMDWSDEDYVAHTEWAKKVTNHDSDFESWILTQWALPIRDSVSNIKKRLNC